MWFRFSFVIQFKNLFKSWWTVVTLNMTSLQTWGELTLYCTSNEIHLRDIWLATLVEKNEVLLLLMCRHHFIWNFLSYAFSTISKNFLHRRHWQQCSLLVDQLEKSRSERLLKNNQARPNSGLQNSKDLMKVFNSSPISTQAQLSLGYWVMSQCVPQEGIKG